MSSEKQQQNLKLNALSASTVCFVSKLPIY